MNTVPAENRLKQLWQSPFGRGFAAILPLWLAAAPFAFAFVIAARTAGIPDSSIQMMSLFMFTSAAQLALVELFAAGASAQIVLLTMLVMNIHHLLYGLTLTKEIRFSRAAQLLYGFFLTDAAFGVTVATTIKQKMPYLLGAELSMYSAWNLFTALGLWLGTFFVDVDIRYLDFVVPLTFFLLLVLVIKNRLDLLVGLVSVGLAVLFVKLGLGSRTVLLVALLGPAFGLLLERYWRPPMGEVQDEH